MAAFFIGTLSAPTRGPADAASKGSDRRRTAASLYFLTAARTTPAACPKGLGGQAVLGATADGARPSITARIHAPGVSRQCECPHSRSWDSTESRAVLLARGRLPRRLRIIFGSPAISAGERLRRSDSPDSVPVGGTDRSHRAFSMSSRKGFNGLSAE